MTTTGPAITISASDSNWKNTSKLIPKSSMAPPKLSPTTRNILNDQLTQIATQLLSYRAIVPPLRKFTKLQETEVLYQS
jgi:hypothetical protein